MVIFFFLSKESYKTNTLYQVAYFNLEMLISDDLPVLFFYFPGLLAHALRYLNEGIK